MDDSNRKLNYYFTRTVEHIHRVQKNMLFLVTECSDELNLTEYECQEGMCNVMKHDRSKFLNKQFRSYIELTEYYFQRKNLGNKEYQYPTLEIKKQVDEAVQNHYEVENHHPEGRDYHSKMEVIEIVCDLQAMAQEFGEGSCRGFFDNVWIKKHHDKFQKGGEASYYFSSIHLMKMVIICFELNILKGTPADAVYGKGLSK